MTDEVETATGPTAAQDPDEITAETTSPTEAAEQAEIGTETTSGEPAKADDGSRPYDVDFPEKFKEFMRTGWGDIPLAVTPSGGSRTHRPRRAALSAAFPGETLVIPSGREQVRANDTLYRFRPGSDFMWLTGEHDPDSVLIIDRRTARATLYIRPRSPRDTDEFFRNAMYGELWIGRRHTLEEKAAELGIRTRTAGPTGRRPGRAARRPAPASCAATTSGGRRDPLLRHRRRRHPRPGTGRGPGRAAPGQGRVGGRPAPGRDRRHRARLRGRRPGPAGRPVGHRAAARGRLRSSGPATTATSWATRRSSAPAPTRRSCTGSATPAPPRPASCC